MSTYELVRFASAEELAGKVAERWLSEIQALGATSRFYGVALSGGRIAGRFLSQAAGLAKARNLSFEPVDCFWGDERCVPPDDAESNFRLAREVLLEPLRVPDRRIHRVRGEDPPEQAARAAGEELCRLAPRERDGLPVLDLVLLGMGEEGHVASLFPGEPEEVTTSPAVYRHVVASKPPPHRITLGYPAIAAARQVWVLASGAGKEQALRESLRPGGRTPLARVLELRGRTTVFTELNV
ncbi:MAG TPA: 6-phosphogluconolactonase [Candidatus Binatia bacterium]|jgi:6-phosphogluconolactonase|nr:6-phosphogluconolactonase [Candidatus Binatia bacterium]